MEAEFSIQQVAQQTELSIDTLRYYERIGLIEPVRRAANGHRRYGERDIAWIRLLIRLRETGMPIAQMLHFAQLRRQGAATTTERRLILEDHQRALEQHMQKLEQHMAALQSKIASIRKIEARRDAAPGIAPISEQGGEEAIATSMLTPFRADGTLQNSDQSKAEIVTN